MKRLLTLLCCLLLSGLPALAQWVPPPAGGGGGSGTVTMFSAGNLPPLFTTTVTDATSTPILSFLLTNAPSLSVFGNPAGTTGAPQYIQGTTNGTFLGISGGVLGFYNTPTSGTVTSFSSGNLSTWFNTSVANPTTTPALTFSPTGTKGDVLYFSANNTAANLPIGASGQALMVSGGVPVWADVSGTGTVTDVTSGDLSTWFNVSVANPTTTPAFTFSPTGAKGDIPYYSAVNTASNLGIGSSGQLLTVVAGVPAWANPATSGTVTSFSAGNLSTWFNTSVSNATSTPALTFNPTGAKGDLAYFSATNTASNLSIGSTGNVLTVSAGGEPSWSAPATNGTVTSVSSGDLSTWFNTSVSNATTTPSITFSPTGSKGDIPYYSAANTAANLGIGTTGQVLTTSAGGEPTWAAPATSGTVTNFTSGDLSTWFNTSVSNGTTTPSLTFQPTGNKGDLPYYSASNTASNLGIGSSGQVLQVVGGVPVWGAVPAGFGGNGADGAILVGGGVAGSGPYQYNATTFLISGTGGPAGLSWQKSPLIINCTSTFTISNSVAGNNLTMTTAFGGAGSGGLAAVSGTSTSGGGGGGPGGANLTDGIAVGSQGGGGGGFGGVGGYGGGISTTQGLVSPGGATYPPSILGGSGGAGGAIPGAATGTITAGTGGDGGAALIVCAVGAISIDSSADVYAEGANGTSASASGGTATAGGGGGGSGGLVFLASQTSATAAGTINVSGGNGGNGAAVSSAHPAGGGGGGGSGEIVLWSPSNTITGTLTMNGGTAGSGAGGANGQAGSNGANGSVNSITGTPNLPILAEIFKPEGGKDFALICNLEKAVHPPKDNVVNIKQSDIVAVVSKGNLDRYCYLNFGDMHGTTCYGVGSFEKNKEMPWAA
jgi:hypothetical protein